MTKGIRHLMSWRCQATTYATMATIALTPLGSAYAACRQIDSGGAEQTFTPDVMEIVLRGEVGSYMEKELIADIESNLTEFPSLKTIKVKISSQGGSTFAGYAMHNYLHGLHKQNGLQIVTHNILDVRSAAVSIYCGGNQRVTSPYSFFMVHEASRKLDGHYTYPELHNKMERSELTRQAKLELLSSCTSLTKEQVDDLVAKETYFDSNQALDLGLAHSIAPATYDRTADIRCLIDSEDEEREQKKKNE